MKNIDFGFMAVLTLFLTLIVATLGIAGREFVRHEMYQYDFSQPLIWSTVALSACMIYLGVTAGFLAKKISEEVLA
jgi:hypothetical protein